VAEQSTVAGGTAGAGTARANDPSAAWYNPAALADNGGLRLGLGLMAAMPDLQAEAMDGTWSTSAESAIKTPPHLYLSHAAGRLAIGVAAGVPFGAGVSWPSEWAGRHEILSSKLQVFRATPFAAWSFGKIRIGGGIHFDFATLEIKRGLDFVDTEGTVDLAMNARGIGVDLSAFYTATEELELGLTYKSRTKLAFSGDADFTAPDAFDLKTADQQAKTTMTLPDRIVLGSRWSRGQWSVLGDLELTMWSVNDATVIEFENDETPDAVQNNGWKSTVSVRAGTEFALRPTWTLRGGAFYDPSPAQAQTLAPSSPDSTRVGATVGVSHDVGRGVSVDAFYEYMQILSRESDNMNSLDARYGGRAQMLGLGVRYAQ
jgi:long-chain fatty acid transport protein